MSQPRKMPKPGEFIKDELKARGWDWRDLAYLMGCPGKTIKLILSGETPIDGEIAASLGCIFNVSSELFINLQHNYDSDRSGKNLKKR